MTHTFVVNTENVNEYGYRILTDGIDTTQFMRNPVVLFNHRRAFSENPEAVIGRVLKLEKKDGVLTAEVEFDENDKFAKKVSGKVERGFIRMASLYADVIEGSTDEALLLPGQKYETITKCKMVELSITDIGGNDDALKLSRNGNPIKLKKIESKLKPDMSLKTIALSLKLNENATEAEIVAKNNAIQLAKETAEAKVVELSKKIKDIQVADAEILIDKAIALGLFSEVLKPSQLAAFEADPEGYKVVLSKMVTDKEAEGTTEETRNAVKEVVLGSKGIKLNDTDGKQSYDYLQKHNAVELARLHKEENAKYVELAKGYANGIRYTEK